MYLRPSTILLPICFENKASLHRRTQLFKRQPPGACGCFLFLVYGNIMRAVIQRVTQSSVSVSGQIVGRIGPGLLVLLGVARQDSEKDADFLVEKIIHLRIFEDEAGRMNRSLVDISGQMLVVSQFTLLGDCRKGRRPSFVQAAPPETAELLYQYFVDRIREKRILVQTGKFRAMMEVSLVNDGPVTFIVESAP